MQIDSKDRATPALTRADLSRCRWAQGDPLLAAYHDAEWGVPERDPRALWARMSIPLGIVDAEQVSMTFSRPALPPSKRTDYPCP